MPNAVPEPLRVEANGQEHSVLAWAPDAGVQTPRNMPARTVVLVHGFADVGATWDLVVPALTASGLRVLAPDMRGFGNSPKVAPGSYYHFVDYVFDLADIVDQMGRCSAGTGTFPDDRRENVRYVFSRLSP